MEDKDIDLLEKPKNTKKDEIVGLRRSTLLSISKGLKGISTKIEKVNSDLMSQVSDSHRYVQQEIKKSKTANETMHKSLKRTEERLIQRDIGFQKSSKTFSKSTEGFFKRAGKSLLGVTVQLKNANVEMLKKTSEMTKEIAGTLKSALDIDTQNLVGKSLAVSSPIIGYFAAKLIESPAFKNALAGIGKSLGALVSRGFEGAKNLWRKIVPGKKDDGYRNVTESLAPAEVRVPKQKKTKQTQPRRRKGKPGIDKVAGKIPKLASGGFIEQTGLVKAHVGEYVMNPSDVQSTMQGLGNLSEKLDNLPMAMKVYAEHAGFSLVRYLKSWVEPFIQEFKTSSDNFNENLQDGKVIAVMYRVLLDLRNQLIPQLTIGNRITLAFKQALFEHPLFFFTYRALRTGLRFLTFPIRSVLKRRGGYKTDLPKTDSFHAIPGILSVLYVGTMTKFDAVIGNLKLISEGLVGKKVDEKDNEWTILGKTVSALKWLNKKEFMNMTPEKWRPGEERIRGLVGQKRDSLYEALSALPLIGERFKKEVPEKPTPDSPMGLLSTSLEKLDVISSNIIDIRDYFVGKGNLPPNEKFCEEIKLAVNDSYQNRDPNKFEKKGQIIDLNTQKLMKEQVKQSKQQTGALGDIENNTGKAVSRFRKFIDGILMWLWALPGKIVGWLSGKGFGSDGRGLGKSLTYGAASGGATVIASKVLQGIFGGAAGAAAGAAAGSATGAAGGAAGAAGGAATGGAGVGAMALRTVGIGLARGLPALALIGWHAYFGSKKAKDWGVGSGEAAIANVLSLGGEGGWKSSIWGLIQGASIGALVGNVPGAIIGAIVGATGGELGGQNIAAIIKNTNQGVQSTYEWIGNFMVSISEKVNGIWQGSKAQKITKESIEGVKTGAKETGEFFKNIRNSIRAKVYNIPNIGPAIVRSGMKDTDEYLKFVKEEIKTRNWNKLSPEEKMKINRARWAREKRPKPQKPILTEEEQKRSNAWKEQAKKHKKEAMRLKNLGWADIISMTGREGWESKQEPGLFSSIFDKAKNKISSGKDMVDEAQWDISRYIKKGQKITKDQALQLQAGLLANAILMHESGGKMDAKGGSGETGGYQFMPTTWADWANKYLGDPFAEQTPEKQHYVARRRIYDWLKGGFTPQQVAAAWNAGETVAMTGWADHRGWNDFGQWYDTPKYVSTVMGNYGNILKNISSEKNMAKILADMNVSKTKVSDAMARDLPDVENKAKNIATSAVKTGLEYQAATTEAIREIGDDINNQFKETSEKNNQIFASTLNNIHNVFNNSYTNIVQSMQDLPYTRDYAMEQAIKGDM